MKHIVATFDKNNKCLHKEEFPTAETAYEYYKDCIRILKKNLERGEEILVARYNDGYLMTYEKIVGTK